MGARVATDGSDQYFIRVRGKVLGPFTLDKLKVLRSRGQFSRMHEVSMDRANWQPATNLEPLLGFSKQPAETVVAAPIEAPPVDAYPIPAKAEPGPAATWHYSAGGERHGPVSVLELRELIRRGLLGQQDFVWKDGMPDWSLVSDVPEMQALIRAPSPPPRVKAPTGPVLSDDGIHHTSGMAVASMVLGILGLMTPFLVFNILATIFGGVAIRAIGKSRIQLGGRGMAISGLVMGVIGLAFWMTVVLFWTGLIARWTAGLASEVKIESRETERWDDDVDLKRPVGGAQDKGGIAGGDGGEANTADIGSHELPPRKSVTNRPLEKPAVSGSDDETE